MNKLIKPTNCTCGFPEAVCRNVTGHAPGCPVHTAEMERITAVYISKQPKCVDRLKSYDHKYQDNIK